YVKGYRFARDPLVAFYIYRDDRLRDGRLDLGLALRIGTTCIGGRRSWRGRSIASRRRVLRYCGPYLHAKKEHKYDGHKGSPVHEGINSHRRFFHRKALFSSVAAWRYPYYE